MKLGYRIFIGYLVIFCVCFYYPFNWMLDNLRTRYLEGVEEPLVDHANILATQIGLQLESGRLSADHLHEVFSQAQQRKLQVLIYDLLKTNIDLQVYIADKNGRLIFDSRTPSDEGKDYTKWRDVRLTLAGEYGARTTRQNPADEDSSVLYVAAPILIDGEISGSVTVVKPTTNINSFIKIAHPHIFKVVAGSLSAAIFLCLFFSVWITRPIQRLTTYANQISQEQRPEFPELGSSEIAELGHALKGMQEKLEGKQYVEEYVQNLTHEIKSPLSAIRGAAELLGEEMPAEQQKRFLENIRTEGSRIAKIVDTMLELAALENRRLQPDMEKLDLHSLIQTVLESKQPLISRKLLQFTVQQEKSSFFYGNSFLLHQALANLVQNAIDFSPPHGEIILQTETTTKMLIISIKDQGPGIPDFAVSRIFEKFYSLQRPDTGKKSTGLGLNFVREVASAHMGSVEIINRSDGGAKAVLMLALSPEKAIAITT